MALYGCKTELIGEEKQNTRAKSGEGGFLKTVRYQGYHAEFHPVFHPLWNYPLIWRASKLAKY
jgi:hypothetical protein